jgi:hypothetical protein
LPLTIYENKIFQKKRTADSLALYKLAVPIGHIVPKEHLSSFSPTLDRNDREVMLDYKQRSNLSCLLAICFSTGDETVHHWSAFAPGSSGCRIDFHMTKLLTSIANRSGLRHGNIIYKKMR